MKYVLFFLGLTVGLLGMGQTKDQARAMVWDMLKRNNPDAHAMMDQLYTMPTKFKSGNSTITSSPPTDFMVYVQQYKKIDVLSDISTAVHEACHMYQSKKANMVLVDRGIPIDFDIDYTVYYISANEEHLVRHTPTFPSLKMAGEITGDLQSFRYETYIKTNESVLGTQQNGVYGLLDEWAAYYNGFKTTVLNFDEYISLSKTNIEPLYHFIQDAASIRVAYPEFKFYIIHYLDYARRKEKKIYDEIMANTDFHAAFRAIDKAYNAVIAIHTEKLNAIKRMAEQKGLSYKESGEFIMIGNQGAGSYNPTYKLFETTLSEPKYTEIVEQLMQERSSGKLY